MYLYMYKYCYCCYFYFGDVIASYPGTYMHFLLITICF